MTMPALGLALQVGAIGLELAPHAAHEQPPERGKKPGERCRRPRLEHKGHAGSRGLLREPVLDPISGAVVEGGQDQAPWGTISATVISSLDRRPNIVRVSRKRVPTDTDPGVRNAMLSIATMDCAQLPTSATAAKAVSIGASTRKSTAICMSFPGAPDFSDPVGDIKFADTQAEGRSA